MKDKLYIILGWIVSAFLIYLTVFIGYCKDPLGDIIIMVLSFNAFIYFSFQIIKEIFE
jgi:hypothetical protein